MNLRRVAETKRGTKSQAHDRASHRADRPTSGKLAPEGHLVELEVFRVDRTAKPRVSYAQAHRRHRQALTGRPCEHCGPLEVSLREDAPAEHLLIGIGRHAGLVYSLFSSDYQVLCQHHHRLTDSRRRRIRRTAA